MTVPSDRKLFLFAVIVFAILGVVGTLITAGVGQGGKLRPTELERPAATQKR